MRFRVRSSKAIPGVLQEKIGISNYLWAFAGQASTKLRNDEVALNQKLEALTVCFLLLITTECKRRHNFRLVV